MTDENYESPTLIRNIFAALLVVVLLVVAVFAVFGLPGLGILGMALTLVVFGVLLLFTAGN
ncbi:hypothetical protein [Paracoccus sp. (in: a-proteobacteria)]|uniref:hypothetical protein n=1 Tax=Paracoccus sp. TaxID=267 RepID=UPI0026E11041|nr:hypothetical protein [Paracoccus sp. (in: a-proteobacteria)]MDO5647856.1 hypothetical protein [Paracoccus sp. (in: a-proteobacteria)]